MPRHERLVQGQVDVVERPDQGADLVWLDELGNVTTIGFDSESRTIIGNKLAGRKIAVANGHVPRTDGKGGAVQLPPGSRPQG